MASLHTWIDGPVLALKALGEKLGATSGAAYAGTIVTVGIEIMITSNIDRRGPNRASTGSESIEDACRLVELNDEVLRPFIEAEDDHQSERAISELLELRIRPFLITLLARFRRQESALRSDDLEEIFSVITLRLMKKLRGVRLSDEHAIAKLDHYTATLAYNTLYDFWRQRNPERHRLKKTLRHALNHDVRLALWETNSLFACGLRAWSGRDDIRTSLTIDSASATATMADRKRPADAICAIFRQASAPVVFDALVNAVAKIWNVRDVVIEHGDFPPDPGRDQLTQLVERQHMEALWHEIRALSANQRAALLLNLRDTHGASALNLLLILGLSSMEALADALTITPAELHATWDLLPLDDLTIAAKLGLTRQQVINLRKAARARLLRRMARRR